MRGKKYEGRLILFDQTTLEERRTRGNFIQFYKIREGFDVKGQYILETVRNC